MLLTIEEIIRMHAMMVERTGGAQGLRDRGLLESAIYSTQISFEGIEKYPSIEEKAARYAYSLISNHAFIDGNKRIGILVMLTTLDLNDITLQFTQQELISLGLNLARGDMDYEKTLEWIEKHKIE